MRISVKLTLYAVVLTALTILICCTILLITTWQNQIDSIKKTGASELNMLNNYFKAEIDVVGDTGMSKTAQRSLILYVFREYTDASVSGAHYVLTDMKDTMFNDSPIDPRPLLPKLSDRSKEAGTVVSKESERAVAYPTAIAELDGRKYLSVGHYEGSLSEKIPLEYEVYLVRDITAEYENITALGLRFALIALAVILVNACLMIFLVRHTLLPIKDLQKSAAALADGDYGRRIDVKGKNEIALLAQSFNKMADAVSTHIEALKDTSEQRKVLLGALTHELKTPMTAIIGYSESLQKVRLSREQRETSIAYINSECRRIEILSQKMMRLITLQGGETPEMKPQPVKKLYEAVGMTLYGIGKEEKIALEFIEKGSPVFNMDIDMMASVIINLFDNSRKAGAKHIVIEAKENTISVQDDGSGIPREEIDKITQPFYMVDKSHSRSVGGNGLGLALCELIIKAHKAKLHIESELGVGTTVMISFDNLQFDNGLKNT